MHPFRAAVEAEDLDAALALFRDDATLDSPVAFRPFSGIEAIRVVLGAVMEVFEDFRYTDEFASADAHVLVFRARVGDKEVEGVDLLRIEPQEGQISNLTVFIRPLSGLIALAEQMQAKVGHLQK
jgi:hypothetical protein